MSLSQCSCLWRRGRGRRKAAGDEFLAWEWDHQRAVIAKGLSGAAEANAAALWQPEAVEDAFVQSLMQTVREFGQDVARRAP